MEVNKLNHFFPYSFTIAKSPLRELPTIFIPVATKPDTHIIVCNPIYSADLIVDILYIISSCLQARCATPMLCYPILSTA